MDVGEYLKHIQYDGPKEASLQVMRNLHMKHIVKVPFDSLDMFGGKKKVLDIGIIYDNIVKRNRGGVCYELNGIFCWLLRSLGFTVKMLNGRAFHENIDGFGNDYDHMVLMVEFSPTNKWIADVGWGGILFLYPIEFVDLKEHTDSTGIYRIRHAFDDVYYLEKKRQTIIDDERENYKYKQSLHQVEGWQLLFKFDLQPHVIEDFDEECANMQNGKTTGLLQSSWFLIKQNPTTRWVLSGWKYYELEHVDPTTLKTTKSFPKITCNELNQILQEKFQISINFELDVTKIGKATN